ncbi:uncharacterized protein TNCV_1622481 [Trichonephila clavipes]|nr:uncharacterized protein TNCV_1622481 [Trichonephila clavipes]
MVSKSPKWSPKFMPIWLYLQYLAMFSLKRYYNPPKKKRKLQLSTSPETEENQPNSEVVTNNETPEDVYFPDAKSKKRKDRKKKFLRDPPTTIPKNERSSVINIRVSRSFKKRPKYKKDQNIVPFLPQIEVPNPIKSARYLCKLFRGCINFVQTSRLTPIEDIDSILKNIVQYGKVIHIQDHWSKSGNPRVQSIGRQPSWHGRGVNRPRQYPGQTSRGILPESPAWWLVESGQHHLLSPTSSG